MANPNIEHFITGDNFDIGDWELSLKSRKLSLVIDKKTRPRGWKVKSVCKSVLSSTKKGVFCSDCSNSDCKVKKKVLSGQISISSGCF